MTDSVNNSENGLDTSGPDTNGRNGRANGHPQGLVGTPGGRADESAGSFRQPLNAVEHARSRDGNWRPKTVLVLSGGGMRGWSHVGVFRAIERLGLQIDEVIGTSMGAVIGCLFAAGKSSEECEEVAREFSVKDYFKLNLLKFLVKGYRHASVYKGKAFRESLARNLPYESWDEFQRPFFCNALSIADGTMHYFGLPGAPNMKPADAIYASSCLPGIFEPLEFNGDVFIDGGMAETLCLKLAHARRADLIIAVDLSIKDHHKKTPYRASLPHIMFQTYEVMGEALNEHNLHAYADEKVVMIKPKVGGFGLLDAPDMTELIRLGEREALEALVTNPLTRYMCQSDVVEAVDRTIPRPRDYVQLDVDMNSCIHCGICSVTCATEGYAAVPMGDVVRKLHNYECTRDMACERNCPTGAIRLRNL